MYKVIINGIAIGGITEEKYEVYVKTFYDVCNVLRAVELSGYYPEYTVDVIKVSG